jgi:biotin-dependent carboxylase-like uncharacterized protein
MIEVLRTGIATTIQDAGRVGWAHLGVGRSGAADPDSYALANRLVGNPAGAAVLETSGGLQLRTTATAMVAITGGACRIDVTDGPPLGPNAPGLLGAGAVLVLGPVRAGLRTYVAVRGGLATPVVLGSRSRDTLGRVGPEVLEAGVIDIGADPGTPVPVDLAPQRPWATDIGIVPGPRLDWFTTEAWALLTGQTYAVGAESDRVGVRLSGALALRRSRPGELASEGLVLGAVQVPPDGQPIVMLADHPTTGGYPVIAVVDDASLGAIVQAAPGTVLRLRTSGA